MQTALVIGALIFFTVFMFMFRYFRAKKKVDVVSERIRAAQAAQGVTCQADKDGVAVCELVLFATENKYNHLTFKDIVSLVPGELICEAARKTVLEELRKIARKR